MGTVSEPVTSDQSRPHRHLGWLALPPADHDEAGDENSQARPEPVGMAISRDEHAEGDEQADIADREALAAEPFTELTRGPLDSFSSCG